MRVGWDKYKILSTIKVYIFPCIKRFKGRPEELKSDVDFLVNASERRSNSMVYIHFDSGYFLNCCIFDVFSNNHILDSHNNMDNT
jgi:hypothetical protein